MLSFFYKKNNKGTTNITRLIQYIFLFILFAFALDVIFLVGQLMVVGYNNNYIANKLMVQGGLVGQDSPHINEAQGGLLDYGIATNEEIIKSTNKIFRMVGIRFDEWSMDVDGVPIYEAGRPSKHTKTRMNYGEIGDLTTSFRYRWRFTSVFLPGSINMTFKKVSSFTSDYYYESN